MKTRIAKWGNSLALRLPKGLTESFSLVEGTVVELVECEEGILLRPAAKQESLKELLKGVKPGNLHASVETGAPRGNEAW